jgi:metal-sulfur cluster biosynthetic enzyme
MTDTKPAAENPKPADAAKAAAPLTREAVMAALEPVQDPEIHLSIVGLGLVYDVDVKDEGKKIEVTATLTSPMCPYGPQMVEDMRQAVARLPGVEEAKVFVVWDPPWDPKTMATDEVKDVLGLW